MKIAVGKQARFAGFGIAWWFLVQTWGAVLFMSVESLGRTRVLGHDLPLQQWALNGLALSLPVGAVAALVVLAIGRPSLLRDGARGFVSGLFSMLAAPVIIIAVIAVISLLWVVGAVVSSLMG